MNHLNAVALAESGWYIIPVRPDKTPYTPNGFKDASNDPQQVNDWWETYEDALIGIVPAMSGKTVIDLDNHEGKDNGFNTAKLHNLPTTALVEGTSLSGLGKHLWFDGTTKRRIGLYAGIDRVSEDGYIIVNYDLPSPEDIFQALPAGYSAIADKRHGKAFSGTTQEWLSQYEGLTMSDDVKSFIDSRTIQPFTGHEFMLRTQVAMVLFATEGHGGVPEGLEALKKHWLKSPHSSKENPVTEWDTALENAIAQYGEGAVEVPMTEEEITTAVSKKAQERLVNMLADLEAKELFAAMTSAGTQKVSLEDLEKMSYEALIEPFLGRGEMGILLGNSNVGKTFVLVAWACSHIARTGENVMLVMGEGGVGFTDRLKAYCDYFDIDFSLIIKHLHIFRSGVLVNQNDLKQWRDEIGEKDISLIMFDTLSATSGVDDENASALMQRALNYARQLSKTAAILFTHHPRKMDEGSTYKSVRGSGAIYAAVDAVIVLQEDHEYMTMGTIRDKWLMLSTDTTHGGKARNAKQQTIQGYYLEEDKKHDTLIFLQDTTGKTTNEERLVRKYLVGADKTVSPKRFAEILEDAGEKKCSKDFARDVLNRAVKQGVCSVEKGAGRNPDTYTVLPDTDIWDKFNKKAGN